MAWYRCGMNGTYRSTTVSRSGAVCNYVANVGGVPLSRFIANITPVQAGSGDPSPSNPRPITGWSAVHAYRSGADTTNPDIYTINLGGTYYGGYLNVTTGLLTVTWVWVDMGTISWSYNSTSTVFSINTSSLPYIKKEGFTNIICERYATSERTDALANLDDLTIRGQSSNAIIGFKDSSLPQEAGIKSALRGVMIVYELATPTTEQLTPAQLTQLLGENNVWADSGDSEVDFFKIIRT